jgi:hypothetical protein
VRNRLFVIDGTQVFWDHAGKCADASYEQVLFGNKPAKVLCSHGDTIAGPRTVCQDETARKTFETMIANLDKADLGLGSGHRVEPVALLPKAGTAVPFTGVAASQFSSVKTRRNVVVRDLAAFQKLWAEHAGGLASAPAAPKVDFTRQMVIGVFSDQAHDACYGLTIGSITAGDTGLVVEVNEHQPRIGVMCAMVATNPMQLVTVDRFDGDVDFVTKTSVDQWFSELASTRNSQIALERNVVVKDAASFARLWQEHAGSAGGVPNVDFNANMVLGVFMGARANGCYATAIGGVSRTDGRIHVTRVDTVPGESAVCTQAVVTPAQLVVVARSDLPVDFTLQEQAR